jgi:nitrogen fixation/metabolism regulation signal transduction histidine kinase
VRWIILLAIGVGAVLLYLLATASANTSAFASRYPLLLALNGVLAALLLFLVGYQAVQYIQRLRRGVFGTRIALRLLGLFTLMAAVPGVLVYVVSVQFLTKSIESWFDVRVERALEGGLNLGRSSLDQQLKDLNAATVTMSMTLAEQPRRDAPRLLNQLREQAGVYELALFDQRGSVIAFSTASGAALLPEFPDSAILRQVLLQKAYTGVESLPGRGLTLRVLVPVNVLRPGEDVWVLQVLQPVPQQLAQDAELVQGVYQDYQELLLARHGLKRLYRVTLTVALLLSLLSALLLAFIFSERLSRPLGNLAEGTRAVAQGDFSRRHPVQSRDELGILTASFNAMTDQLEEAREETLRRQSEVEAARAYLASILASVSSGVVTLDADLRLRSANRAACDMLGAPLDQRGGARLAHLEAEFPALGPLIVALSALSSGTGRAPWERQVERSAGSGVQVLLARGAPLPEAAAGGFVVVFDDITDLIRAQRSAAWGEVARRLAHEIKNPLTPIQLAAERLQHKLGDKLGEPDTGVLERATRTIVAQVQAMKRMVDDFSEYARPRVTELSPLDINQLVQDILPLYEGVVPPVRAQLALRVPAVRGDAEKLRQVMHNLIRNAQDASGDAADAEIVVSTSAEGGRVRLTVTDDGAGFREDVAARAFEPYVTTKAKGTGLGLAIVKKIVDEHDGTITLENRAPRGARVSVELPALAAGGGMLERKAG